MTRDHDWTRRLGRLRRELDRELARIEPLRETDERREELEDLLRDLDHQLERARAAGVVVLVGSTGAGKSTMLNALSGQEISTEGESRPTTSVPTVFAPEDADLSALLSNLAGPVPGVVRHPSQGGMGLSGQVLIDAPDVNSIATEHRQTVTALAERADVLLVVLHRQSIVEQSSVRFLEGYGHRRRLVFALNRADELTEEARADLISQVRALASQRLELDDAPVFAVSARRAKNGEGGPPWRGLLDALEGLLREGNLAAVRRHNAIGAAHELAAAGQSIREKTDADLGELHDVTRRGLLELVGRAHGEVAHRLDLRHAELSNLLLSETGKRWDGPGGWSLRIGAWSAVGAGLGLALARRNPLAAAGLAAGGAVVSRVRGERERKHLEESLGLLPEAGELRTFATDALAPARLRAGRLTGDPAALGVPGFEAVLAELEAAVTESWGRLMNREVPEAAESSAPAWLRWPLDLPVYALAGWIVYRAGEGFFTEEYVGLDFLLNGVLLALALLFVLRLIVRSVVSSRARGLIRASASRIAEHLNRAAERLAEPSRERAEQISSAVRHVGELDARWRAELTGESSES